MKKYYLVTEFTGEQDGLGVFTYDVERKELPPNACVLTREQVEAAMQGTGLGSYKRALILDELFGTGDEG